MLLTTSSFFEVGKTRKGFAENASIHFVMSINDFNKLATVLPSGFEYFCQSWWQISR